MSVVALSGQDTIIIDNRILSDLADGNCVELTFNEDIATLKTGKNGNSIYGLNESGRACEVVIRVVRGSADDKFLNSRLTQMQANFAGFILLAGQFIKKIGKGDGQILSDKYVMGAGIFTKQVGAMSNVDGEVEQSVSIYNVKFANAPRAIA